VGRKGAGTGESGGKGGARRKKVKKGKKGKGGAPRDRNLAEGKNAAE